MGEQAAAGSDRSKAEGRLVRGSGGVSIFYEVIGRGERTLLLANGLGGRLYSWEPLLDALQADYRLIVWDYRGLFESAVVGGCPLSVRDHAEDALRVLDQEGVRRAVWVGWSMGVQVTLEAASLAPERVAGMVLLNGTYGHVFSSALQPGFRVPVLSRYMHELVELVRSSPALRRAIALAGKRGAVLTVGLFWLLLGRRALALRPVLAQYVEDIFRSDSFPAFLQIFQELDAHSAYHHLPKLRIPSLVVSGRFDVLTPPYQSRLMARRLPQAEHLHVRGGSHFVLLERPEQVVPRVRRFLETRAVW